MKEIEFWFSIGSTYTYLSVTRLAEVIEKTDKAVMGGIPHGEMMVGLDPRAIEAIVHEAVDSVGGHRLLLAPNCSLLPTTPDSNLFALRKAVQ